MKVTVITATYNSASFVKDCINSVVSQTYNNIEYIVVDSKSTDKTPQVISSYKNYVAKFICEKDNGIYDAINKGIGCASGDIIGILHSDDMYANTSVISDVVDSFKVHKTDSVYGDLQYVDRKDKSKVLRYWKSGLYQPKKLPQGWMPPHPTFFIKRDIYLKYGLYDTSFSIAADYDLILRFLGKCGISTHYIPEVLIKMRTGGISNKNIRSIIKKSKEDLTALKNNDIGNLSTLIKKNLIKIPQFLYQTGNRG